MLPKAQKEVLLSRQDLRQLWGSESDSNMKGPAREQSRLSCGEDGKRPGVGQCGSHVLLHFSPAREQPFKGEEGCSEKGVIPNLRA